MALPNQLVDKENSVSKTMCQDKLSDIQSAKTQTSHKKQDEQKADTYDGNICAQKVYDTLELDQSAQESKQTHSTLALSHIKNKEKSAALGKAFNRLDHSIVNMGDIFHDMCKIYEIVGDLRNSEKQMKKEHKRILDELKATKEELNQYSHIQKEMQGRISEIIQNIRNAAPVSLRKKIDTELKDNDFLQQTH